jgi:Dolichyl-phosphate-mannose-protein mannosyltransferase
VSAAAGAPEGATAAGRAGQPAERAAASPMVAPDAGAPALPRGVWVVAGLTAAVLAAFGGGYGYHRDELYFQVAGRHPAFGYPDQPPLVPLLAAGIDAVDGGRLWIFRLVPALLVGATVVIAGLTSRELAGTATDRIWTAAALALCPVVVGTGHLFSTTTFDLALTSACVLLLMRAVTAPDRIVRWLALGVVAAVALEVKTLPATVLLCCGVGLLVAGPRAVLLRPGPWIAGAVAAAGALPNLVWQAENGWPQLALARAIAAGSSGTSVDRWLVVPLQLELTGPVPAVPFIAGLVVLLTAAGARRWRWLAVAYLVMLAFVVVTGGKPYYLLGLVPAVVAAGVPRVRAWLGRGRVRLRRTVAGVLVGVHALVTAVIGLPVVPVTALASTPVVDINYDAGETVGWDAFTATARRALAAVPADRRGALVIVASNYGEAGALDRARREGAAIPPVYSGHNAYGLWGPPPGTSSPVLAVGYDEEDAARLFSGCSVVARVDNGYSVDNDEQGVSVRLCNGPVKPWPQIWPEIRFLA